MRTVGRIIVILLAALLVAGAAVVLVDNGTTGGRAAAGHDDERPSFARPADGERPDRGREGREFGEHDGEREGSGGSFLAGILKNLGTIALIVAGVVLGQWLWSRIAHRRTGREKVPGETIPVEKSPDGEPI